ncbi:MAG: MFS transporter [Actinobacteria bacterium]|nr:MFS transporter [Actinomycetota bacterium]MSW47274.1 MFS transporter [Actinomycetota bacterium]MSX24181.1 MFS transporter [Actinomycetota bacterium]MSY57779.1 MFS transporter [Actinomycetota bacterium]MTB00315.1 MFS transporter [Actinomycetota bacterium]
MVAASFFVAVGFGIVVPAIPLFTKSFGVNNSAVGLIISAFAIARFSSGLISGKLVDRFGERPVFTTGIFMVSISSFLCAFAHSYHQLLIFRSAGGLGSSMFSVAAGSIIMRSVSDEHRGRAQSVYNGSFLVGGIAGPAIGGAISAISLRAPFISYGSTLIIAGAVGFFFLSPGKPTTKAESKSDENMGIPEALKLAPYRTALVLTFLTSWVLFGLRSSILPLFVTEELHSTTAVVGLGFTIAALLQGLLLLPAGDISDRQGRRAALLIGTTVVLCGVLMLIFAVHPWMYLASMAIVGLGGAFLSTTPANIVGDVIRGKSGQVIALWQMAGDLGMIIGPIAVGALSDLYSFRTAFTVSAIVFSIAIVLAIRLPETRKSHLQ